ncbi:hypothetical protein CCP1ISM_60032 [Azospirillaceae bacterium]
MKTYLECGYEDRCKNKDCLHCPRRTRYGLSLTLAEEIAVEDFAVCDLRSLLDDHEEKETELRQKVMINLMKKIFRQQ